MQIAERAKFSSLEERKFMGCPMSGTRVRDSDRQIPRLGSGRPKAHLSLFSDKCEVVNSRPKNRLQSMGKMLRTAPPADQKRIQKNLSNGFGRTPRRCHPEAFIKAFCWRTTKDVAIESAHWNLLKAASNGGGFGERGHLHEGSRQAGGPRSQTQRAVPLLLGALDFIPQPAKR